MNRTVRLAVLALVTGLAAAGANAQGVPGSVAISDISVIGNTLLPQASLDATLAPFKGQRTMDDIKQAAAALQDLYRKAGYGGVVTFLPEQAVAGGRLVIGVLEGKVARVEVLGSKRAPPDTIRRAVPALAEGRTPEVKRIDTQVQLANDNASRKLAVTLEAGRNKGEVDAVINVTEAPPTRWVIFSDNTGNAQTGRIRLGLQYQNDALFDSHQLWLQGQFAPENASAVRIFSANYRVPLYSAGLLLNAFATYSNVDAGTTATAAGALQFNGKGRSFGLSLARVLDRAGAFEQRVALAIEKRDYLNDCAIQGLPAGACGSAGESVSVHPLTVEYTAQRAGDAPLGVYAGLAHNLAVGGGQASARNVDAVRPGAKVGFTVARGAVNGSVPVVREWGLNYRVALQATGDALVSGEQFGIGGASAVRGYEEREITGDSGAVASLEMVSPDIASSGLRAVAFADAGMARNQLGTPCNANDAHCSLASVGLGARFKFGPSQLKLDVAQALKEGRTTQSNTARVHFQASVPLP